LTRALNRAVSIFFEEFGIPGDLPIINGCDCAAIGASWGEATAFMLKRIKNKGGRRIRRLTLAIKSCKRLFDVACGPCDKKAGEKARREWDHHVGKDVPQSELDRCSEHLPLLRERIRELIDGWGKRLVERRKGGGDPYLGEYVPGQQGCCEVPSGEGGTLACGPDDYSGDRSLVRRGVAKTKGKHRVVTMQSAEVKRVLTPVHNALYDHISSKGWCVRGEVRKEDFDAVISDQREGEEIISGDYKAATDNLYLPAVEAVIAEVSKCPELTEEEREVLLESFTDLRWKSNSGARHPIKRGSMMGNLVSFPLLCLLNKASFDIACDVSEGKRSARVGRFNGDDCCFNGDSRFFKIWRHVTSIFGFVVNEEKTGVSRRWAELNSSIYDVRRRSFVAKAVVSFLHTDRAKPGSILASVIDGIASFRWSLQLKIVNVYMRYEIALRGVLPEISCLGRRWRKELLSRRWFRSAALLGPAPVLEKGVKRDLPVKVGPPPVSEAYEFVTYESARLQRAMVDRWTGVRVVPFRAKIDRKTYRKQYRRLRSPRLSSRFEWKGWRWAFVWPRELLLRVKSTYPWLLDGRTRGKWKDDHPFLTRRPIIVESPPPLPLRNPVFAPQPPRRFGDFWVVSSC
jgi:hypothetical protein